MQSRPDARLSLSLLSLVAAAATIVACGSTTTTSGGDSDPATTAKDSGTSGKGATSSGSSGSSGSDTTDAGSSTTDPDSGPADCSKTTDAQSCFTCCDAIAPAEIQAAGAVYDDCACAASACATQCADSYCGSDPNAALSTACETCLQNNDTACQMKFDAACTSANCTAAVQCEKTDCAKYNSSM